MPDHTFIAKDGRIFTIRRADANPRFFVAFHPDGTPTDVDATTLRDVRAALTALDTANVL